MEKNIVSYTNLYTNETKSIDLSEIECSKYDYLLKQNKNYMNNYALSFNNQKITYEELHENINKYAIFLYKKGIRKGDKIGVCLDNTPEGVYLLYALDIIGAVIVGLSPLNNNYKMQRDIEMTKLNRIISVNYMYSKIKNSCDALNISPILYTHNENDIMNISYEKIQKSKYKVNQLTDILFTGGSTGIHKGVDLTSSGLNYVAMAQKEIWPLKPGMIHLGNIPLGHMVFGRSVLHYSLCNNLEYALTLNIMPNNFFDELVRTKANGAMGGPIHWENLINNPNLKKGDLINLIQATSGGEMLKEEKFKQIQNALKNGSSNAILGDGLGITEMWAPIMINIGGKNTIGTIGYPIPLAEAKIVNPEILDNHNLNEQYNLEEVPIGSTGLLLVRSPGMMLGYHNNPKETKKVFIYDNLGNKWYNTGDLIKRTGIDDNEYKFSGRKKRNFVCGVDNIYPEQIESLLLQIPEIREAIITPIADNQYQFLPSYHISLYNNLVDINLIQNKIEVLIERTLGPSALPGYIDFIYEPFKRTDRNKIDVNYIKYLDKQKEKDKILKKIK